MMRCRPGTVQSYGRALLELGAVPDQRRTASRILTWEFVQRLVYALALRRIRDTAAPRHQFK
jgi:hypothetical protein